MAVVACPQCKQSLSIPPLMSGQFRCPKCRQIISLAGNSSAPSPTPLITNRPAGSSKSPPFALQAGATQDQAAVPGADKLDGSALAGKGLPVASVAVAGGVLVLLLPIAFALGRMTAPARQAPVALAADRKGTQAENLDRPANKANAKEKDPGDGQDQKPAARPEPEAKPQPGPNAVRPVDLDKPALEIDAPALIRQWEGNQVQFDAQTGKVFKITGAVGSVQKDDTGLYVLYFRDQFATHFKLKCLFDTGDEVGKVQGRQIISVVGLCAPDKDVLTLQHCRLAR